jgi:hypothetical protein
MSNKEKLDSKILNLCKFKKTLVDFLQEVYNPIEPFKPDEKTSEEMNMVGEEFMRLVFFIRKLKNIFKVLNMACGRIAGKETTMPNTEQGLNLFIVKHKVTGELEKGLRDVYKVPYYKLLRSFSEIPKNSEFNMLGEIDTREIEEYLGTFDPIFKEFVGVVLKKTKSFIVPK